MSLCHMRKQYKLSQQWILSSFKWSSLVYKELHVSKLHYRYSVIICIHCMYGSHRQCHVDRHVQVWDLCCFLVFSIQYAIKLMLTKMQYIAVQKPIIIISNFKCYQVKRKLDLEDVKLEGFKTPKSCKRRRGSEASPRGNCYFTASFYCIMFF